MDDVRIRPAQPGEYEAIGELTATAFLADGLVGPGYADELRRAADRAEAGDLLAAVDAGSGDLLGTASLFTFAAGARWAEGASDGDAVLRMVAVAPAARRRGVARALTLECIRRAEALGCSRLILSTGTEMKAAQALYEQLGFRRNEAADWEPVPGVTLLAYVLPLPASP